MKTSLLIVAMLFSYATFAQNSFTLSTYTATYEELLNPQPVDLDDEGGDPWDDPFFLVPIGFDFEIGGETYNSTFQLGAGAMMGFGDIFLGDTSVHLFGSGDDLIDATEIGLDTSIISYETVGSPGDKIFKIQYKNAAFYEEVFGPEPAAENRTNFQLWFYENGGILEIHYGMSNIPNPETVYYGNLGPSTVVGLNYLFDADIESLEYGGIIVGSPSAPILNEFTTVPDDGIIGLSAVPLSGRVFRLTPSIETGVSDVNAPKFKVFPTVVQNELWVKDVEQINPTYHIFDITGKEVQTGKLPTTTNINVSILNPGVYLISIDGMSNAAKFIKK